MKKFTKFALAGIVASVAATWYLKTPQGQRMKKKVEAKAHNLYERVKEESHRAKATTQRAYHKIVDKVVDEYVEKRDITTDVAHFMADHLKDQWQDFEKALTKAKKIAKR